MAKRELLCCGLLRAAESVGPTAGPRAPSVPVLPRPLPARCRLFILLGRRLEAGEMEASGHRLEGGRPHGPGPTCKTRCALCVAISVVPQMCPHDCGRRGRGRGERRERGGGGEIPPWRKENRDRELARAGICPNSGITAALTKGSCFATGSCVTNIVFGKSHILRSQVLSDDMSPPGLQAVLEGFCSSNLMCQQP